MTSLASKGGSSHGPPSDDPARWWGRTSTSALDADSISLSQTVHPSFWSRRRHAEVANSDCWRPSHTDRHHRRVFRGPCLGTTDPPQPIAPNGSFAAPFFDGNAYLAVSLRESGGIISGIGWSNITDSFLGGATVAGSYSVPAIQFDLHPRLGGTPWHFNGTVDTLNRTLAGEFAVIVGRGLPVVLQATDTIATGVYDLELDSGTRELLTGSAGFTYLFDTRRLALVLRTQGAVSYHTSFTWNGPTLPLPGTYQTSASGAGEPAVGLNRVRGSGVEAQYQVAPGTITIELSDRYVLAGRYTLTATDPNTGARLTLRGTLSAGCFGGNKC